MGISQCHISWILAKFIAFSNVSNGIFNIKEKYFYGEKLLRNWCKWHRRSRNPYKLSQPLQVKRNWNWKMFATKFQKMKNLTLFKQKKS
jgi:hypothetical protein